MSNRRSIVWGCVALAGLLVVGVAATRSGEAHEIAAHAARAVPAPAFASLEAASRQEMLRYAESLQFDTSYHAKDTRRLMVRRDGRFEAGPLAVIVPEIGVRTMKLSEMYSGRIIARITADAPFPAQGLAKGENYVWADKVDGQPRAVIIPGNTATATRTLSLEVIHEGIARDLRPEARFRWNDLFAMEDLWVRCEAGCCKVSPGIRSPTAGS